MPLQTIERGISVADSQNLDSFSKVRVSEVTIQSYINFKYGGATTEQRFDTTFGIGGSLSWGTTDRGLGIGRSSLSNVTAGIRVPTLAHYTAGTTLKTYVTFKINDASLITGASSSIYVGAGSFAPLGQLDCGFIGLSITNSVYAIKIVKTNLTSSSSEETYLRSDWDDKLDGTGESKVNLDFSKLQILFVKQQSGRNGQITVGFVVDGEEVVALKVKFVNVDFILGNIANISSTFGPCAGIASTGTGGAIGTVLTFYEGVAITEDSGKYIPAYYQFSHTTVTSSIPSGSFKRIVTYRLNTTIGSFFTKIILSELEIMSTGSDGFYWELRYLEDGSTSSFTTIDSNSNLQYNITNTTTSGSATVITGGFVNAGEKSNITLPESIYNCYPIQSYYNFAVNSHRTISLWIKPFSTSTSSVATITYKEIK
jgi:hypothetical protein